MVGARRVDGREAVGDDGCRDSCGPIRIVGPTHDQRQISGRDRGVASNVDRFSSGVSFDGWKETGGTDFLKLLPADYEPLPVSRPQTWLLCVGWRRHGLISVREVPGERARRLVT